MRNLSFVLAVLLFLSACGVPRYDPNSEEGRRAILDQVNISLTHGNCAEAISLIEPLYASNSSNNEVRMVRASAHGCLLGIDFFGLLGDIATMPMVGPTFWSTTAQLFYSSDLVLLDKRIGAGAAAADALMAALRNGAFVPTVQKIDLAGDGFNVGSIIPTDRTLDSSLYLVMTSMATIGALQNRYSNTNSTTFVQVDPLGFTAARPLGWALPANYVTDEGCEFAAAVLNYTDGVDEIVAGGAGGGAAAALAAMNTLLKTQLATACQAACQGNAAMGIGFAAIGCALGADTCNDDPSRPCPLTLRDRSKCPPVNTDRNTCAAAGISMFVNDDTLGWSN